MIRCVAIDDEPIALSIIREYCNRYGNIALTCFSSPVAGMEHILASPPDIVFLDIEMKSHTGIDLARRMPPGVCVIFTTAFSRYAMDGFNLDAVDFLHKPIFYPRFEHAMEKALRLIRSQSDADGAEPGGSITLKADHKNVVVRFCDIICIEAMDNYVKVFRRGLPTVVSQITMKEMEGMLPDDRFIRVHRSFIVSIAAVDSYSNRKILLRGYPEPVPVGRKYLSSFNNLSLNKTQDDL